ncbi:protein starmaker-like [Acropora muricata]|uniref:protein starmaker-like n=1 Tax=Acropora muricata TaxID=159855 RepID=UPI0034E4C782
MSKRKCFCRDCNGRTRSWNTVKRHRALGCEVQFSSSTEKIAQISDEDHSDDCLKAHHPPTKTRNSKNSKDYYSDDFLKAHHPKFKPRNSKDSDDYYSDDFLKARSTPSISKDSQKSDEDYPHDFLKAHYAPSKPRNSRDSYDDYSDDFLKADHTSPKGKYLQNSDDDRCSGDFLKDCSSSSQSSIHSTCSSDESCWMDEAIEAEKKHDMQSEDSSDDEEINVLKDKIQVANDLDHSDNDNGSGEIFCSLSRTVKDLIHVQCFPYQAVTGKIYCLKQ